MSGIDETRAFLPVGIAIMTVSDTRTPETDTSGNRLEAKIREAGHIRQNQSICRRARAIA